MIQKRAKLSGMLLGLTAILAGCGSSGGGSGSSPAPTAALTANPAAITVGQGGSTLAFTSTNAETGSIDNNVGPVGTDSHILVSPTQTTTYTYTATGPGGSATAKATVTVSPAPTVTITASHTSVTAGQSTTLTVVATNATQVVIADNQDTTTHTLPAAGGTLVMTPLIPTTYQATASGANGSTAVETVSVNVTPTVTLSASPTSTFPGQSVTLTWTSTSATSVVIEPLPGGVEPVASGIGTVSPTQTTTYTATATGNNQEVTATAKVTVSPVNSFDGMAEGSINPKDIDPNGAVGTLQFMEYVNTEYQAYDKTTLAPVWSTPQPFGTPWASIAPCSGTKIPEDAVIIFDRLASRWVLAAKATESPDSFYYCIAISSTDDLSSPTLTWYAYSFNLAPYLTNISTGQVYLPDWPKLGTWWNAYYATMDMYDNVHLQADVGVVVCAFDRTDMLLGNPMLTPPCVAVAGPLDPTSGTYLGHSLIPADVDGTTPPPTGRDEFMVSIENPSISTNATTSDTINLWDFQVNWTAPTPTLTYTLTSPSVPSYIPGCYDAVSGFPGITNCVPEPAAVVSGVETGQVVDSVGDRFMPRFAYRNFGTYESFLISHTVETGLSGSEYPTQTGIRWYEFRDNLSGTPSVHQSGTINPDTSLFRFLPSIAQDKMGNAVVGYSVSNRVTDPGINASYWSLATLGAPPNEFTILNGTGEEATATGIGAWGSYSSMTVDPADDCTFWYVNEYWPTDTSWSTRIANFTMPGCQ
jgi:hypothetical protein